MPAEYDTNRMTPQQRRDLNRSKLLHDLAIPFLIVGMAASLTAAACSRGPYRKGYRQSQSAQSHQDWRPPMRDTNQQKPRQSDRPRRDDGNGAQIYNGFTNSTSGSSSGLFNHP